MTDAGHGELKHTPLKARHLELGARMIPFGGWLMPVQYGAGILAEHRAVRQAAGLFDLSHMGELEVRGPNAPAGLQRLLPADLGPLRPGEALYSFMCRPDGGLIDDLVVYRTADGYLLVVNAANIGKDRAWLQDQLPEGAILSDQSDQTGLVAVQGPLSVQIVTRVAPELATKLDALPYYHFVETNLLGVGVLLSRTGYTGEDGFEIYARVGDVVKIWDALLEAGTPLGLLPVGLGARDTLRLEMRYPLYGNDIDETTTPLEAGLGWAIAWEKGDFISRDALLKQKESGVTRRLVGFEVEGRGVPRHGYGLFVPGETEGTPVRVGTVTSGAFSPTRQKDIGMGYIDRPYDKVGTTVYVEIRGKLHAARIRKGRFAEPRIKG